MPMPTRSEQQAYDGLDYVLAEENLSVFKEYALKQASKPVGNLGAKLLLTMYESAYVDALAKHPAIPGRGPYTQGVRAYSGVPMRKEIDVIAAGMLRTILREGFDAARETYPSLAGHFPPADPEMHTSGPISLPPESPTRRRALGLMLGGASLAVAATGISKIQTNIPVAATMSIGGAATFPYSRDLYRSAEGVTHANRVLGLLETRFHETYPAQERSR